MHSAEYERRAVGVSRDILAGNEIGGLADIYKCRHRSILTPRRTNGGPRTRRTEVGLTRRCGGKGTSV